MTVFECICRQIYRLSNELLFWRFCRHLVQLHFDRAHELTTDCDSRTIAELTLAAFVLPFSDDDGREVAHDRFVVGLGHAFAQQSSHPQVSVTEMPKDARSARGQDVLERHGRCFISGTCTRGTRHDLLSPPFPLSSFLPFPSYPSFPPLFLSPKAAATLGLICHSWLGLLVETRRSARRKSRGCRRMPRDACGCTVVVARSRR